ncbi:MAG: hypothetical protein WKF47_17700 [Geodermatophilaceae bacterium]
MAVALRAALQRRQAAELAGRPPRRRRGTPAGMTGAPPTVASAGMPPPAMPSTAMPSTAMARTAMPSTRRLPLHRRPAGLPPSAGRRRRMALGW